MYNFKGIINFIFDTFSTSPIIIIIKLVNIDFTNIMSLNELTKLTTKFEGKNFFELFPRVSLLF